MGAIGWEVTARDVITTLSFYEGVDVTFNINSPGGSLIDGLAIYDYMVDRGVKATSRIYGNCGSAATVIACASRKVYIGQYSSYFIHNAYIDGGTTAEQDDSLKRYNAKLVEMYAKRTGMGKKKVREMMDRGDKGYYLMAEEAVELGFADGLLEEAKVAALHEQFRGQAAPTNPNSMNAETEKPEVEETPAPEAATQEAPANDTTPEVVTEEVEIELSLGDRIRGKAKVNVDAELKAQLETAIEERKTYEVQAKELSDELERSREAFAEVSAEAQAKTDQLAEAQAKVEELEAKLANPLAEATGADAPAPDAQNPGAAEPVKKAPMRGVSADAIDNIQRKLADRKGGK